MSFSTSRSSTPLPVPNTPWPLFGSIAVLPNRCQEASSESASVSVWLAFSSAVPISSSDGSSRLEPRAMSPERRMPKLAMPSKPPRWAKPVTEARASSLALW